MNKDTSQIRDILTLKEKSKKETLSIKQQFLIILSIFGMLILTYIFGHFTKLIEDINYTILMTSAIFLIAYLSVNIHLEYRYQHQLKTKYSMISGLLPNLWSSVAPYLLALALFSYFLDDLIGILVIIILALFMTALVFATYTLKKEPYISYKRFLMKSVAIFVCLYLIFTLMQGMMISLSFAIAFSIVILLDFVRMKIESYYERKNSLFEYFNLTAKPYFLMLLIFSLFFQGFLFSKDQSDLRVFRSEPIELLPKVKHSIDLDLFPSTVKVTELANQEFAISVTDHEGIRNHYIYNMNYEKIFEITLDGYDIVQGSPYVFRKLTHFSTPPHLYSIGIMEDFQSDFIVIEDVPAFLVSVSNEQMYIFPSSNYFDILKDGVMERYDVEHGDDQFEFQNLCDAFIRMNGTYQYFTCQFGLYIVGVGPNPLERRSTFYHNGLILVSTPTSIYFASDINQINQTQQLADIKGQLIKFNYDQNSILTLTQTSAFQKDKYQPDGFNCQPFVTSRLDLKGRLDQRLITCSSNMFIAHHELFILRRNATEDHYKWSIDVIDGYDMSYYAIRKNVSLMTYLFTPLFMIGFVFLNGIQFKKTPNTSKLNLFE